MSKLCDRCDTRYYDNTPCEEKCKACEWYEKGRTDYKNDIFNFASTLNIETECLNHTENDCGEWLTMTIDYAKWCELWWFIEKGKRLADGKDNISNV